MIGDDRVDAEIREVSCHPDAVDGPGGDADPELMCGGDDGGPGLHGQHVQMQFVVSIVDCDPQEWAGPRPGVAEQRGTYRQVRNPVPDPPQERGVEGRDRHLGGAPDLRDHVSQRLRRSLSTPLIRDRLRFDDDPAAVMPSHRGQDVGQGGDPVPARQENFGDLARRTCRDANPTPVDTRDAGVVTADEGSVHGQSNIDLDAVGTALDGSRDGLDSVLGTKRGGCAAVRQHEHARNVATASGATTPAR